MNDTILERAAIIKLHQDGLENWEIIKISRKSRDKVGRTINRYKDTGSLENRKHKNYKRDKRTPKMLKALKEILRRNTCRKKRN